MIKRELAGALKEAATQFPVVALLGPRQSGKTTLAQNSFKDYRYVSLEDLDIRALATLDPRRFLEDFAQEKGVILDEIQHVPTLLSYIQTIVDRENKPGFFILTGSQNLLVNQAVTQTLAGRIAILTLLPLSIHELNEAQLLPDKIEEAVFKGSYPRLYASAITPTRLYSNYIRTYVERDVRQIKNISDLSTFQRFIQLCAARSGQLLNLSSLGNDCGIDHKTAQSWISILEASYIVFLLNPYYKNFGKRVIKSPKLYFYDTGIACSLLRIKSVDELSDHYLRGNLIENFIIADLLKQYYNRDQQPPLYFWRDQQGHEIDCVIEEALELVAIEIKSGKTVIPDYFTQLNHWKELTSSKSGAEVKNFVIYGGATNSSWPTARVLSWKTAGTFVQNL